MKYRAVPIQNIEQKLCVLFAGTFLVLFAVYVYLVSSSVRYVVLRTELEQDIQKVNSEISALEGKYIQAQLRVSERVAALQGYDKISDKTFIDRTRSSLVLSDGGDF